MSESGSRPVILNHWGVQNFLARGNGQAVVWGRVWSTSGYMEEKAQSLPILAADLSGGTSVGPNLSPE